MDAAALDRVWLGDITHLPNREGFVYLSTVLGLASRRCVGWAARDTLKVDLVVSALRMARDARHLAPGLIFHSDRGSQYASAAFRRELAAHAMRASVSGKGDCYGNSVTDGLFATFECEVLQHADWRTRADAPRASFRNIEAWYNRKRRPSTLGYVNLAANEPRWQVAA